MKQTATLIGRNLKRYFRDRGTVFFSLLTMLIVIALMLFFLGDMNIQSIVDTAEEMHISNLEQVESNAKIYFLLWTVAGILAVNTVTVTLTLIGFQIKDSSEHRMQSFFVSPVSRLKISLGYIGAAWICSMIIGIITLIISEIYVVSQGAQAFSVLENLEIIGMVAANSFTYAALMNLISQFVKNEGAWSGFGTVIGTLVGFLGAIYIPMGGLPEGVQTFLKCTPVLYGTSMLRSVMTAHASETLFADFGAEFSETVGVEYAQQMGVTVSFGDNILPVWGEVAIILICGIILAGAAVIVARRKRFSDR